MHKDQDGVKNGQINCSISFWYMCVARWRFYLQIREGTKRL